MRSLAVEYGVLGAGPALLRQAGRRQRAGLLLADRVFDLDYSLDPLLLASGVAAGAVLIGLAGMLAVRGALNAPLMSVLRGD